jgi:hypothetical protein
MKSGPVGSSGQRSDAAGRLCRPRPDVLGCVKITDADAFLDLLHEGGSGYHFFGRWAQKLVLERRPVEYPAKVA